VHLTGIYEISTAETTPDDLPVCFNPALVIANPVADIQAVEGRRAAAAVASAPKKPRREMLIAAPPFLLARGMMCIPAPG